MSTLGRSSLVEAANDYARSMLPLRSASRYATGDRAFGATGFSYDSPLNRFPGRGIIAFPVSPVM